MNAAHLDLIGSAVRRVTAAKTPLVNVIRYEERLDALMVVCLPFIVLIGREQIEEFREVPPRDMKGISLSSSGTTLKLTKHNIYIEVAGLISDFLRAAEREKKGGLILDLLRHKGD